MGRLIQNSLGSYYLYHEVFVITNWYDNDNDVNNEKSNYIKSNFLLCRLFFLSDHNFISNEGNLIIDRKIMLSGIRSKNQKS